MYIDNLSVIGDRDTKPDELNFDFEIPLPLPIIDNSQTEKISLLTFKNIINKAAEDDKIKGIYLNVENVSISFNKAEKVRDILEEFKKKNQFTHMLTYKLRTHITFHQFQILLLFLLQVLYQ